MQNFVRNEASTPLQTFHQNRGCKCPTLSFRTHNWVYASSSSCLSCLSYSCLFGYIAHKINPMQSADEIPPGDIFLKSLNVISLQRKVVSFILCFMYFLILYSSSISCWSYKVMKQNVPVLQKNQISYMHTLNFRCYIKWHK